MIKLNMGPGEGIIKRSRAAFEDLAAHLGMKDKVSVEDVVSRAKRAAGPVGMETARVLEISTGHMTPGDNTALENDSWMGVVYYPLKDVGWLIWVGSQEDTSWGALEGADGAGMSEAFKTVMRFARESGITWVKFDKDSPHYDCFEVFEW